MATTQTPDRIRNGAGATTADVSHTSRSRRLVTETKAAFKTTEFFAFVAVLAGLLVAGLVVDGDGRGADGGFSPSEVWLYATILTVGYMLSRGIAKAGSHQPYDEDNS